MLTGAIGKLLTGRSWIVWTPSMIGLILSGSTISGNGANLHSWSSGLFQTVSHSSKKHTAKDEDVPPESAGVSEAFDMFCLALL